VHDGREIFLRGYGMSRVETDTPVDAGRTLFRIGSVTKPLTAAAVLQLVDEGVLDLHRDVRQYIPRLSLPYGATTHQLLTHTAGFDETFAGGFTRAPGDLRPLAVHVEGRTAAAMAPGQYYSYGNAHYSMAGRLLERLTGLSYEDAIATRLFEPLKMTRTTARQPPEPALADDRAIGYEWDGSAYRALPFRYTQSRPAGAVSTTAGDMSRFMLALLGDGPLDGVRVLSPSSRAGLLQPQFRDHPRLPGVTYAFHQWATHGRMLLHHDGTLGDQVAVMLLDPANRFGLFVASNANPGIGNHLLEPVLTHLYGPAAPPAPRSPMPEARDAGGVAGVYLDTFAIVVACLLVFAVSATRLLWTWRRWSEGRAACACALWVALAHLVFTVWLAASLRMLGDTTPLPLGQWSLLALGVAAAAVSALLPAFAFVAWRERRWSRGGRVSYTLLAACAVVFGAWLDAWKLLGFKY